MTAVELVWRNGALSDDLVTAVLALADQAFAADGVSPLSEVPRLALRHRDQAVHHLLVLAVDAVAAYAQVDSGAHSAELVVAPAHRRRGYGRRVLNSLFETYPDLQVWAHGNLPGASALARAGGASPRRELLLMRQTVAAWLNHRQTLTALTPTQSSTIGPNQGLRTDRAGKGPTKTGPVQLRHFIPGQDEPAWLALNAAAFAGHPEQGQIGRSDLDKRLAEDWFEAEGLILAVDADRPSQPIGYVWTKLTSGSGAGEIYAIGVNPHVQGRRIGTTLLAAGLDHLSARGATDLVLYVEASQAQAVRLYHQAGFVIAAHDIQYGQNYLTG